MIGLKFPRPLDWMLILAPILIAAMMVALSGWTGRMFDENGPVEMLQLAVLATATALFVRAGARLDGWCVFTVSGLAFLSLLFLVREAPRCDSPLYEFGACFPGDSKLAFYVLPVLIPISLAIINPALRPNRFGWSALVQLPRFLPRLLPLLILVPLIGGAQVADATYFPITEELLELTAYLILVVFGLRAAQAGDSAALLSSPALHKPKPAPRPLR